MKLSIVISLQPTKFSALALQENLERNLKLISTLGYDGVELAVRNPEAVDIAGIEKMVRKFGLAVPAIGTGQAYVEEGLSFSHPGKEIRQQAVKRIKAQIEFASRLNRARVIIGLIRGKTQSGLAKAATLNYFKEGIIECANFALPQGVELLLEPLNRYETDLFNTLGETVEFIKSTNLPNFFLLADTFHMNIEEVSFAKSLDSGKDYLRHVHFADSNRWAPGCGHLDFKQVIEILKSIQYNGYLSAEILPLPTPEESARLTIQYLKELF